MLLSRPAAHEHNPYFGKYIDAATRSLSALDGGTIPDLLTLQPVALRSLLEGADESIARHAYAPGKWTLAESLVHVADAERVFAYRLLHIARGDQSPLPSFDQDSWVPNSSANARALGDILTELDVVRAATLVLVHSIGDEGWSRQGTTGGNPVTARALAWIIAGHFAHHIELTRERYLAPAGAE